MVCPLVSESTIPCIGTDDTMTGMYSKSKLATFKLELESGEMRFATLSGALQEILGEEMTEELGATRNERTSHRLATVPATTSVF